MFPGRKYYSKKPIYILKQTLSGRIHPPRSVFLPQLGEAGRDEN
jgi:hypothetical protein